MERSLFERYGALLAALAVFLMPFKLTFGYIGLIPLIVLWLDNQLRVLRSKPAIFNNGAIATFILFLTVAAATSVFGINPARSIAHFGTLFFFPLTICAFYDLASKHAKILLFALCSGQATACLSSILEDALGNYSTQFLGPVSQSGQITLTFFAAIALIVFSWDEQKRAPIIYKRDILLGVLLLVVGVLLGFHTEFSIPILGALSTLLLLLTFSLYEAITSKTLVSATFVSRVLLPLIAAGLLVNLKRGPWVGVLVGFCLFCLLHRPKLLLFFGASIAIAIVTLDPVQSRLLHIHEHFFLSGGRNTIWEIGYELAMKYPLGIGFENSGFLRLFSNEIPDNLKHFHNNILNLLVETGWAGCALFCMSMLQFITAGFHRLTMRAEYRATTALACGLVAWQVAGFVEYNFGDSSVVSIAYAIIGMLLYQVRAEATEVAPA